MRRIVSDRKQIVEPHNGTTRTLVHEPVGQRRVVVQATETGRGLRRPVPALRLRGPGHRPSAAARQPHALRSRQSPAPGHGGLPVSDMPAGVRPLRQSRDPHQRGTPRYR